jgi:DNA-binding NtrC family response regulator
LNLFVKKRLPEMREHLVAVIASSDSMEDAARRLGVSRRTLYRRCAELGITFKRHA